MQRVWTICLGVLACIGGAECLPAAETNIASDVPPTAEIEQQRLDLMRDRVGQLTFTAVRASIPKKVEQQPLFRYDGIPRGYVDGTVWRLGSEGRPLAIVTAELHPRYLGSPRIVYDLLSLSSVPFVATSPDIARWSPPGSAVTMSALPDAPSPEMTSAKRLSQMKRLVRRFSALQDVEGQKLELRLLPQPIDRYEPFDADHADGAVFLFVAGRNPGVVLLIETNGESWQYGIGRLSGPSLLTVTLDESEVWRVPPSNYEWNAPYTATNAPAIIPGIEE